MALTQEQMEAMLTQLAKDNEQLKADLAAAKAKGQGTIAFKVSEKKAVSVTGLGRFPVTLYGNQWLRLIDGEVIAKLKAFIESHRAELSFDKTKQEA